jgi:hypothetical protein
MRLIFTFPTLQNLLAAEKALRLSGDDKLKCRSTPTPPGLEQTICGVSIELFASEHESHARQFLEQLGLPPKGVHRVP